MEDESLKNQLKEHLNPLGEIMNLKFDEKKN